MCCCIYPSSALRDLFCEDRRLSLFTNRLLGLHILTEKSIYVTTTMMPPLVHPIKLIFDPTAVTNRTNCDWRTALFHVWEEQVFGCMCVILSSHSFGRPNLWQCTNRRVWKTQIFLFDHPNLYFLLGVLWPVLSDSLKTVQWWWQDNYQNAMINSHNQCTTIWSNLQTKTPWLCLTSIVLLNNMFW